MHGWHKSRKGTQMQPSSIQTAIEVLRYVQQNQEAFWSAWAMQSERPSEQRSRIDSALADLEAHATQPQSQWMPLPDGLDTPDKQGYWAFEGYVGDNPNVMGRQDVVWVHNIELGIIVSTWGDRRENLRDYHGKWIWLQLPWQHAHALPAQDAGS